MKNNRRLPLISLIAVSAFVCLAVFVIIWILSVDAKTIPEKIQSSLTLGIPSAIALIVLLWLGAGIDHLLARIQKKPIRILTSLGVYFIVPGTLCIGLPALLILLISGSLYAPEGWKQLPTPPSRPVEVVAAGEAYLYIQADSGNIYYCWIKTPEKCWEPADKPEERIIQNSAGTLNETSNAPASNPPGEVKSMISIAYNHMGTEVEVHYAVLNDGSVWVLTKNADQYESSFASGLFLTLAIIPALLGLLVIYLGAGVSALARRFTNQASAKG